MVDRFPLAPDELSALLASDAPVAGPVSAARTAQGAVGVVTLNRTESHNSITLAMWIELTAAIREFASESSVIVLRGAGGSSFSVGADITEFAAERMSGRGALDYSRAIADAIDAIRECPVPVIAMIRGLAVGGGCELAAACDLRIADRDARLGIPIGRLGVTLGLSEASALVDLLGQARAKALVLGGRLVDADEALRIGLLDIACDADGLVAETAELVLRIAAAAPQTIRATKRVLAAAARGATRRDAEAFAEELFSVYEGDHLKEGVAAFRERRDPDFTTGREKQ